MSEPRRWSPALNDSQTSKLAIRDRLCQCRAEMLEAPLSGEYLLRSEAIEHLRAAKEAEAEAMALILGLEGRIEKLQRDMVEPAEKLLVQVDSLAALLAEAQWEAIREPSDPVWENARLSSRDEMISSARKELLRAIGEETAEAVVREDERENLRAAIGDEIGVVSATKTQSAVTRQPNADDIVASLGNVQEGLEIALKAVDDRSPGNQGRVAELEAEIEQLREDFSSSLEGLAATYDRYDAQGLGAPGSMRSVAKSIRGLIPES